MIGDVEAQMVQALVSAGASHAEAACATEVLRRGGSLLEASDVLRLPRPSVSLVPDLLTEQLRLVAEEAVGR